MTAGDGPSGAGGSRPSWATDPEQPVRSNLRSQDLVSLPVLRALLQERNVTRAGEVVGLSQPATSNALARLRRRFGDELLMRVGREYELTPLGQTLLARSQHVFEAVERLFDESFDPATSTRQFALHMSDYAMFVLAPALSQIVQSEAPRVRLNLRQLPSGADEFSDTLRRSDGLVLPQSYIVDKPHTTVIRDRWVCIVSADNRRVGGELTVHDLTELPWVASFGMTAFSSSPPVRQLRSIGIEPDVTVAAESFFAVPYLVAATDRIAFMPERIAVATAAPAGARIVPSPLPLTEHRLALFWDPLDTKDLAHEWFRGVVARAAALEPEVG